MPRLSQQCYRYWVLTAAPGSMSHKPISGQSHHCRLERSRWGRALRAADELWPLFDRVTGHQRWKLRFGAHRTRQLMADDVQKGGTNRISLPATSEHDRDFDCASSDRISHRVPIPCPSAGDKMLPRLNGPFGRRENLENATCKIPHTWRRYGGGFRC